MFLDPVLVLWPKSLWALDDFPMVDWIPVMPELPVPAAMPEPLEAAPNPVSYDVKFIYCLSCPPWMRDPAVPLFITRP